MRLYTFWRSQASYRVRIALALKGMEASLESIDLLKGEQAADPYRRINPEMMVPTLVEDDGTRLFQSLAIVEYLDETRPDPPLLPGSAPERAYVRAIAHTLACDAHPLIIPRIRSYLRDRLALDQDGVTDWLRHWLDGATQAVEAHLGETSYPARFCLGDRPTLADVCLVPHLVSASMLYDFDMSRFPRTQQIFDACMALPAFADTHPKKQPDAG